MELLRSHRTPRYPFRDLADRLANCHESRQDESIVQSPEMIGRTRTDVDPWKT
jgi:hypothetical protein